MARKNKKLEKLDQYCRMAIMMHLRALNLRTIETYEDWCQTNGFSRNLKKTASQRRKELEFFKLKVSESKLKRHKKEKNRRYQIRQIYIKNIKHGDIEDDALFEISRGFRNCAYPKLLYKVLIHLEDITDFVYRDDYVKAIIGLVNHRNKWIRPLEEWKPNTHNTGRQFSSLVRHLFAKYDVPIFMDNAWLSGNARQQGWFIHISEGKNIRKARGLPIELTKKMAHYFLEAPPDYTIETAFRRAQVLALGGNRNLVKAINETRLNRCFKENDFWLSVFRFFVNNPMLDMAHVHPIVDYIWNQKYEDRVEFVERGVARDIGPAQPNFCMNGRTAETLLRQVDRWHQQLGRESRGGNLQWKKSDISNFNFTEGNAKRSNMKIWTIHELLSSKELIAEGRAQGHCVASYAHSCFRGKSAIYTMDMREHDGITKMVTIEVNLQTHQICQVRGKRNRLPTSKEMDVLKRWAEKESIQISNYLM